MLKKTVFPPVPYQVVHSIEVVRPNVGPSRNRPRVRRGFLLPVVVSFEFLLAECSLAVIGYSVLSKSVHTDDPERQLINSRDETSGYPVSAGHGESVFQTSTFLVFLIIGSALPWTLVTLP